MLVVLLIFYTDFYYRKNSGNKKIKKDEINGSARSYKINRPTWASDLGEIPKKRRNQETQSTRLGEKKNGTCDKVTERGKMENADRVSKLQILRKSRARDTQRHLAGPNASHGANDAPSRRGAAIYARHAGGSHRRGCTLQSNPEKGGKRIKKAICRDIIKTKTRAARGGKGTRQRDRVK